MRREATVVFIFIIAVTISMPAQSQVLITQYYEGSSFNKWIELVNASGGPLDFSAGGWHLGLWSNANTETYKTDGAPSSTWDLTVLGTVPADGVVLLGNSAATSPPYALATATNDSVINFNGNDSVVLYTAGPAFVTANIVDAIGFTEGGSEGANTSWVRLLTSPGWDTTAGSNVTTFASEWAQYTNSEVDIAGPGYEEYLGETSVPVELQSFSID